MTWRINETCKGNNNNNDLNENCKRSISFFENMKSLEVGGEISALQ
jgi:hypothetical protein